MIRLYGSSEKTFTTNGIGILHEATACEVEEELNGSYELTMTYPSTGTRFNDLQYNNIIFCKPNPYDEPEPFRIYEITKNMDQTVEVSARHLSYQLSYIPVLPFRGTTLVESLKLMKANIAEANPYDIHSDFDAKGALVVEEPRSIRSILGDGDDSFIGVYGGEVIFSKYDVHLVKKRGENRGVTISYGKDLLDLTQENSIANTITGIMPYYMKEENITIDDVSYRVIRSLYLPEKVLHTDNSDKFPYPRTIPVDFTQDFEDVLPTVETLRLRGKIYILENELGSPEVNLTVKFAELRKTEEYKAQPITKEIKLGDTINVEFPFLGVRSSARVVKTSYDVIKDEYISVDLGDAKQSLAGTVVSNAAAAKKAVKNVKKSMTDAEYNSYVRHQQTIKYVNSEIEATSAAIRGVNGGYIVLNLNDEGKPFELLATDNENLSKAKKLIRLNQEGLAFTKTGYDGDFTAAITIDGTIDGQKANIINLNAASIIAGILQDRNSNTVIDLDNGGITTKILILDSDRLKIQKNGTIRTTRKGGGMDNYDSFLEIAGAYLRLGVLSHSEGGSAPYDYNENYLTAGATDGTETAGKKNSAFNLQSHGITFDTDYIKVTKNRRYIGATVIPDADQTLPFEGQTGSIKIGDKTVTFVNGLMVTGLS